MCFRTSILINFGNFSELIEYKPDLILAYLVGFKFDTVVLTYCYVILVLLNIIICVIPYKHDVYYGLFKKFQYWYIMIIGFLHFIILIIDFYFYKFFQSHINLLFFGIVEDDTKAVLLSVWTDYPIIKLIILIILFLIAFSFLIKRLQKRDYFFKPKSVFAKIIFAFVFIVFYGLGMRGSLGTFPLEKDDATISKNHFINDLTLNGVFALRDSYADRQKYRISTDIPKMLVQYGFKTPAEAVGAYLNKPIDEDADLQKLLLSKTPVDTFLKSNPPHVVFVLMESMSNYYLDLHTPSLNLLGTIEEVLDRCILFRNFLPASNGTIPTIESLLVNTPRYPLAQSKFFNKPLSSSVALPFLTAGYHTSLITGAKLGWRNFGKYASYQYLQTIEGRSAILSTVKGAESSEWGVYDEYMFQRIIEILENANDKPQFIFAFSTSNHTPFELPGSYQPLPVKLTQEIKKSLRTNEKIAIKNFTNYQYANDCLGGFIKSVMNSALGRNTIIVATGDHNTMQLFNFTDNQILQKLSVPLLWYIPDVYMKDYKIDTDRFASHKDIFPTLFTLSLSDAVYLNSGNNLFSRELDEDAFYAVNNYDTAMNKYGCVLGLSKPLFYSWENGATRVSKPTTLREIPEFESLLQKTKAFTASMNYFVQTELLKK
jgi:phosphoglycerol transferase MdoB-like AlkP superfamily enzyme